MNDTERLNIQLVTMTLDEVERMVREPAAPTFRDFEVVSEAAPPEVVLAGALRRHRAGEEWSWCAPRLFLLPSERRIIGSGGFKNSPHNGAVEIGCGVASAYRGQNFATEGVHLLVGEAFSNPVVTAVTAETAVWNIASQRVLEKALFMRSGERVDPEDGPVVTWRRERIQE
jgi:RimJ/RimL family protein N-acetyltransferase